MSFLIIRKAINAGALEESRTTVESTTLRIGMGAGNDILIV